MKICYMFKRKLFQIAVQEDLILDIISSHGFGFIKNAPHVIQYKNDAIDKRIRDIAQKDIEMRGLYHNDGHPYDMYLENEEGESIYYVKDYLLESERQEAIKNEEI